MADLAGVGIGAAIDVIVLRERCRRRCRSRASCKRAAGIACPAPMDSFAERSHVRVVIHHDGNAQDSAANVRPAENPASLRRASKARRAVARNRPDRRSRRRSDRWRLRALQRSRSPRSAASIAIRAARAIRRAAFAANHLLAPAAPSKRATANLVPPMSMASVFTCAGDTLCKQRFDQLAWPRKFGTM